MIILTILKIIGIVLLCVIAFAVLVLLLVLFVPIDYKIKVKGDGEAIDAKACAKWLFGFLGATAELEEKNIIYKIKVAGISIKKGILGKDSDESDKNKKLKKSENNDNKSYNTANIDSENIVSKNEREESEFSENKQECVKDKAESSKNELKCSEDKAETSDNKSETENNSSVGYNVNRETVIQKLQEEKSGKPKVKIYEAEQEKEKQKADEIKQAEREQKQAVKTERKAEKAKKKAEKEPVKNKLKNLLEKAKDIKSKAEQIKRALDTRTGQRAKTVVKSEIFRLLRKIKPQVIKGSLVMGLEDPAKTAEVYGIASQVTYLISDGRLIIEPDFDNKIIKPDVVIKGRIFLIHIVSVALKIILNRDVSRLWKEIRRITNG